MNVEWITPGLCYALAAAGALVTAVSQLLLKTQANTSEEASFLRKFLNPRVIISYGMLLAVMAMNQVALIYLPASALPCFTATSFFWIYLLGWIFLKEKIGKRKILGVALILAGVLVSRL